MQKVQVQKEHILEAFNFRHACKEFDPKRVISPKDFEFLLKTAQLSPSSFGFEPWKFLVVQDPQLREKLRPVSWGAQKQLPTSSHFVITLARTKQEMSAGSDYLMDLMRNTHNLPEEVVQQRSTMYDRFLRHDFALYENERAMFEWACRQTYIALGNMMTAAALIGIDSCPIEGFDKAKVEEILISEGLMDPKSFGVSHMVAFGYRVNEPRAKTRQSMEEIVKWV